MTVGNEWSEKLLGKKYLRKVSGKITFENDLNDHGKWPLVNDRGKLPLKLKLKNDLC